MPTPLLEKQADRVNITCHLHLLWSVDNVFENRPFMEHWHNFPTSPDSVRTDIANPLFASCNGALQPRFWDLDDVEKSTELQTINFMYSGIYLRSFLLGLNHVALKLSILNCSPMWTDTQIHLRRVAMYRLYIWCCNLTWIHVMFCFPHTCGPKPKLPPHGKDVMLPRTSTVEIFHHLQGLCQSDELNQCTVQVNPDLCAQEWQKHNCFMILQAPRISLGNFLFVYDLHCSNNLCSLMWRRLTCDV